MDDWTLIWFTHYLGPSEFAEAFRVDRPLLGWFYVLTAGLFSENLIAWQFFAIFARWLASLGVWVTLKGLWPEGDFHVAAAALLFTVYPGFISLFIPFTYSPHIFVLAATLFSLGLMIWAVRSQVRFWPAYLASIVLGAASLFTMEYYFGLELLRPVFLWMVFGERITDRRARFWRVGRYWLPYALVWLAFLVWRIATPTPRGEITIFEKAGSAPFAMLFNLGKAIVQDLFEAGALAWKEIFSISIITASGSAAIFKYGALVLGAALLAIFLLTRLQPRSQENGGVQASSKRRWALQAIFLGLYALLLSGLPAWMTNWRIDLDFPYDRFTMAMMLGAALGIAGLCTLLTRTRLQNALLIGILVGLAAGHHFQVALTYRKEWLMQRDFFWQLVWRAPNLQPGTAVLITEMPFQYNTGNSLTAPLNWTYAPESGTKAQPYLLYEVERYFDVHQGKIELAETIDVNIRELTFRGSTGAAIAAYYRPPACLKLVDPQRDRFVPDKPPHHRVLLPLSRLDLILPDAEPAASPPLNFFGPEPEHAWCYTFQKAELARQAGDWELAASLADLALKEGRQITRRNAVELLPFIEAYAHENRWEQATALTLEAYQAWENTPQMLCDTWANIGQAVPQNDAGRAAVAEVQDRLQCNPTLMVK